MPRKLEEPGPDRRRNDALCAHTGDSGAVPAPLRGMTMSRTGCSMGRWRCGGPPLRGLPTPQHRSSASHLANEAFVEQIFSSCCAGRSESQSSSPSHARQGQIRAHAVTDSPASINRRPDRRHPKGFRGASERLPGRACRRSRRAPPPNCIWGRL